MADEEKNENEEAQDGEEKPKKDKGPLKLMGAVVGLLGVGAILATMAVPSGPEPIPSYQGPYHLKLFSADHVSNTPDNFYTRYIKSDPHAEYFAYDEAYITNRALDPLFTSWLEHEMGQLVSRTSMELSLIHISEPTRPY